MGVDLLSGPIEIEKKREGTQRTALRTAELQSTIDSSLTRPLSSAPLSYMKREGS